MDSLHFVVPHSNRNTYFYQMPAPLLSSARDIRVYCHVDKGINTSFLNVSSSAEYILSLPYALFTLITCVLIYWPKDTLRKSSISQQK